jgi:very-short-patch-repair endonuclease
MRRKTGAPRSTSPCTGEVGRGQVGCFRLGPIMIAEIDNSRFRMVAGRGSHSGSQFSRTPAMTSKARALRKAMTRAETKLWSVLRRDQLETLHFRRQHSTGPYVLDFYCPELQMAVELDGGQHGFSAARARDRRRTKWLASKGITVLRFRNNDVIENLEGVWSEIVRVAESLRLRNATPSRLATRADLPLSGGGKEHASREEHNS